MDNRQNGEDKGAVPLANSSTTATWNVRRDSCWADCELADKSLERKYIVGTSTVAGRGVKRVHNFNAGPAALPLPVLERIREELLDWHGSGMAVEELSQRSPEVEG